MDVKVGIIDDLGDWFVWLACMVNLRLTFFGGLSFLNFLLNSR